MAQHDARQRGFCPGVFTPMEAGDGLIVRPRIRRGRLRASELLALANAATAFGNGTIELTRRANLQLRGVSPRSLPDLQAELSRIGLAGSRDAPDPSAPLALCPLSGLEAHGAALELAADALERALVANGLGPFSDKLLVVVHAGRDLFDDLHADVRLDVRGESTHVRIAGTGRSALELATCCSADVAAVVIGLLATLASLPGARRLRDVVAARGLAALRALVAPRELAAAPRSALPALDCLGFHTGEQNWLGLGSELGWVQAEDLAGLARLAERFGSGELRLTPRRELLLVGARAEQAAELIELARAHRFNASPARPRVAVTACSGAPACRSAQGETRSLAADLAELVNTLAPRRLTLHVSGCEKSCARTEAADITVVHATDGPRLGFGISVADAARTPPLAHDGLGARLASFLADAP
jgi:precorrin-3B synthase